MNHLNIPYIDTLIHALRNKMQMFVVDPIVAELAAAWYHDTPAAVCKIEDRPQLPWVNGVCRFRMGRPFRTSECIKSIVMMGRYPDSAFLIKLCRDAFALSLEFEKRTRLFMGIGVDGPVKSVSELNNECAAINAQLRDPVAHIVSDLKMGVVFGLWGPPRHLNLPPDLTAEDTVYNVKIYWEDSDRPSVTFQLDTRESSKIYGEVFRKVTDHPPGPFVGIVQVFRRTSEGEFVNLDIRATVREFSIEFPEE